MKKNNIISDWLDQYGDPKIDKKVEMELERITNKRYNMNKLISIGFLGNQSCYLNIDMDDAKKRYMRENDLEDLEGVTIREFEFTDQFEAYDVWGI